MTDISKHTKISLNEVLEVDPQYLIWWYENVEASILHVSKNLYRHAKAAKDIEDEGFYDDSMYSDINY